MVAKLSWTILGKSPDANPEKRAGKAAAIRAAPHRASRSRSARGGLRGSYVARWPLPSPMAACAAGTPCAARLALWRDLQGGHGCTAPSGRRAAAGKAGPFTRIGAAGSAAWATGGYPLRLADDLLDAWPSEARTAAQAPEHPCCGPRRRNGRPNRGATGSRRKPRSTPGCGPRGPRGPVAHSIRAQAERRVHHARQGRPARATRRQRRRGASRILLQAAAICGCTRNTETDCARRCACSLRLVAAAALCSTSAAFCCVTWSSCVTA